MASLLALARAEIEESKRYSLWRTWMHRLTLIASVGALLAPVQSVYPLSVMALVTEALAWWCRYVASTLHGRGEEARRRALLLDSFGRTQEPLDITDLRARFSPRAQRRADKFEDTNYYASSEPPGLARLRGHLQESAFWSKHLYDAAAIRSRWHAFGVPVILTVVIALAWPVLPSSIGTLLARALVLFLSLLFAFDEFSRNLAWGAASAQAERVDRRLEALKVDDLEPVLALFGDYSVATAGAPPIPSSVYQSEKARLDELWKQRKAAHGAG